MRETGGPIGAARGRAATGDTGHGGYVLGKRKEFTAALRKVPEGPATLAFVGATVFTGQRGARREQAVAIRGDVVLAVGSDADIRRHINADTRVVNAEGRTVLPGLIETHGHLPDIVERAIGHVDRPSDISDMPAIDGWVRVVGADPGSIDAFDRLRRGRPGYWESHSGAQSKANSTALDLARRYWSTQKTFYGKPNPTFGDPTRLPVPPGGRVDERTGGLFYANNLIFDGRDASGRLPDYEELGGVMPQMSYEILKRPLEHTMRYFAANGITGFHNMMGTPHDLMTLARLEQDGLLTTRVYTVQGMSQAKLHTMVTPRFLALMDEVRRSFNSDRLWTGMVKFNDSGTSVEELAQEINRLNGAGLQAAIHTHGDKLEAIARANVDHPGAAKELRHRLEHTMGDVARADQLGTGGTIQFSAPPSSLARHQNALRHWGAGTDWDVITDINPMRMLGLATGTLGSIDEALHGYTSNAAWLGHAEDMVGSLEPGKKADVVLLNRDILAEPSNASHARPLMTVVDGKVVFEAPNANGDPVLASYDHWLREVQAAGLAAAAAAEKTRK
ncbi:MAG: amidohydrolase family protein [Deltaproteobacteria bacterium]|nr:amidohydrolase family protein [Deltaproteobacteria bacterium]